MIGLLARGFLAVDLAIIVADLGSADAMTDTTTQLAILADALVKIIDLGPLATSGKAAPADILTGRGRHRRAGADRRRHLRPVAALRGIHGNAG